MIDDTTTESETNDNDKVNVSSNRFNIRDEMLRNGNFDLQSCIDYIVNHLGVKYFTKIRQELDNDNP